MNEDGTPIESEDVSTDNISAENGGVTTTPDEVADILHLPKQTVESEDEEDKEDESEESEGDNESDGDKEEESDETDKPDEQIEDKADTSDKSDDNQDVPTFTLEVEDSLGEKFVLKPGDDLEEVLKDFEPKSNGQIFAILDKLNDLKIQKEAFDKEQAVKAQESETNQRMEAIQTGWNNEIKALQGAKRLEVTTDGKPSERVNEVFAYMGEENAKRAEDGRPLIQSFEDALDKLELKETKEAAAEKAKEEKELNRKKGGMVGGSSAPNTNSTPVYKGGARNSNEALRAMGILK